MLKHTSARRGNVFLRALGVDLRRVLLSNRFLLAVGLMLIWLGINGGTDIFVYGFLYSSGIPTVFDRAMTGVRGWGMIVLAMATVPYSASYLTDRKSNFDHCAINRAGFPAYAFSRVVSTGLSAFLAMTVAAGIFLASLCLSGAPIDTIPGDGISFNGVYTDLVIQVGPWCYFMVRFILSGLSVAMAAVFALYASTLIPNAYVVLISPLILYYGWDAIISILFRLSDGTLSYTAYFAIINNITFQVNHNPCFSFLWSTVFLLTLTTLWGRGFILQLRKEQGL